MSSTFDIIFGVVTIVGVALFAIVFIASMIMIIFAIVSAIRNPGRRRRVIYTPVIVEEVGVGVSPMVGVGVVPAMGLGMGGMNSSSIVIDEHYSGMSPSHHHNNAWMGSYPSHHHHGSINSGFNY